MNWMQTISLLLAGVMIGQCFAANELPEAWTQSEICRQVDVVPMPKRIKLLGEKFSLNQPLTLVLGRKKSRQSEIGVEWIMREAADHGAPAPAVAETPAAEGWSIIIGTRTDNPLIEQAAAAGLADVGENNPGERGYEIRVDEKNKRVYLAGADAIGALYACVTFGEMFKGYGLDAHWQIAEVRDWPDNIHFMPGSTFGYHVRVPNLNYVKTPEERAEYFDAVAEDVSWRLRRKITVVQYRARLGGRRGGEKFVEAEWADNPMRDAIQYGKERGVSAYVSGQPPFVGLRKNYPEVEYELLPDGSYAGWMRCWGLDDIRRETAENYARFLDFLGVDLVFMHDTDAADYFDPAEWNRRGKEDRERWGDDYTSALINKINIYAQALQEFAPKTTVMFCLAPYGYGILDKQAGEDWIRGRYGDSPGVPAMAAELREKWTRHFERLQAELPERCRLTSRESTKEVYAALRTVLPRAWYNWIAVDATMPVFSPLAANIKDFCSHRGDFFVGNYSDCGGVPLQLLAMREYTWNRATPGLDHYPFRNGFCDESYAQYLEPADPTMPLYTRILPHVARNLFGDELGTLVADAVAPKMFFQMAYGYVRMRQADKIIDDSELGRSGLMEQQAQIAEQGAALLDKGWEKLVGDPEHLHLSPIAIRQYTYLRELYHVCMWCYRIKERIAAAEQIARDEHNEEKAGGELNQALSLIEPAGVAVQSLAQERLPDPIFTFLDGMAKNAWRTAKTQSKFPYPHLWTMLASQVDFDLFQVEIEGVRAMLPRLTTPKANAVAPEIRDRIIRERKVLMSRSKTPMEIDGKLDEPVWREARPVESFNVLSEAMELAQAHTRVWVAYDDDNLYFAFHCRTPENTTVQSADMVEIFLQGRGITNDYVHFMLPFEGADRHQYNHVDEHGVVKMLVDNNWRCDGFKNAANQLNDREYVMEVKLPRAAIGDKLEHAKVNLCRNFRFFKENEASSIVIFSIAPAISGAFHNWHNFRPLIALEEGEKPPVPQYALKLADAERKVEVMPDATGTVMSFNLGVTCDMVMHNVVIFGESYGEDGKLHRRTELEKVPVIMYAWESNPMKPFKVAFNNPVKNGAVKIIAQFDEGSFEQVFPFSD